MDVPQKQRPKLVPIEFLERSVNDERWARHNIMSVSDTSVCAISQAYRHSQHPPKLVQILFDELTKRQQSSFICHELKSLTKLVVSLDVELPLIHHVISKGGIPWQSTLTFSEVCKKTDTKGLKLKVLSNLASSTVSWHLFCILYSNGVIHKHEVVELLPKILEALNSKSSATVTLANLLYNIVKDDAIDLNPCAGLIGKFS
jgi:hypothetical protein